MAGYPLCLPRCREDMLAATQFPASVILGSSQYQSFTPYNPMRVYEWRNTGLIHASLRSVPVCGYIGQGPLRERGNDHQSAQVELDDLRAHRIGEKLLCCPA